MTGSCVRRFVTAVACGGFGATLVVRPGGGDVWWHVRTGEWIREHRAIPQLDPFSHTYAGEPWRYTEWLAQLVFHGVHAVAGAEGLVWMKVGFGVLLAWLVSRLAAVDRDSPAAGLGEAFLVGIWGAASHGAMALKPQMFSYLGFAIVVALVLRADAEGEDPPEETPTAIRRLWWIPPLMALWANLHRGGTLALFVMGAAALGWAVDVHRRRRVPLLALVLVASAVALVLNPGGLYYITSAFDLAGRGAFVAEWQPLTPTRLWSRHTALIGLAVLWVIGWARARRKISVELLLVMGTAVLAGRAARFVPFLAMGLVPASARAVEDGMRWLATKGASPRLPRVAAAGLAAIGFVSMAAHYVRHVPPALRGTTVPTWRIPMGAAEFLHAHPPAGRMWNHLNVGGYMLYALAPEQKVFIDGRTDTVYDAHFSEQALRAPTEPELFRQQVRRHHIGYLVFDWSGPADPRFRWLSPQRWPLVYWDDAAVVLVRRSVVSGSYASRYVYDELHPSTAFRRITQSGSQADAAFQQEILEHARRRPESLQARYLRLMLYRARGDHARYRQELTWIEREAAQRGLELR